MGGGGGRGGVSSPRSGTCPDVPGLVCGKFPIMTLEMSLQLVMIVGERSSVGE